jgi:hypothetical protein
MRPGDHRPGNPNRKENAMKYELPMLATLLATSMLICALVLGGMA